MVTIEKPDMKYHTDSLKNFRQVKNTRLYRSAIMDESNQQDIEVLHSLGIKSIIDLRSSIKNPKLLDVSCRNSEKHILPEYYVPHKVTLQKVSETQRNLHDDDDDGQSESTSLRNRQTHADTIATDPHPLQTNIVSYSQLTSPKNQTSVLGKWLYVDLINVKVLFLGTFKTLPWYGMIMGFISFIIDAIFKTNFLIKTMAYFARKYKGIVGSYCAIADLNGFGVNTALKTLIEPGNFPAVITCRMGKDRTGIICALIQRCCGIDKQVIIDDYQLSEVYLEDQMEKIKSDFISGGFGEDFAHCRKITMEKFLDWIDNTYGSVEDYMSSIGFNHRNQKKLRQLMIQEQ